MTKTELHEINVKLSKGQKKIMLGPMEPGKQLLDALTGNDTLLLPATVTKRLERNRASNQDIKMITTTNITKQVGGGLLSSILPLVKTFGQHDK